LQGIDGVLLLQGALSLIQGFSMMGIKLTENRHLRAAPLAARLIWFVLTIAGGAFHAPVST
jgi:hypothetical protein